MRKLIRRQYSGERGFTMLELLIVIIILGILAAVLVPRLMSMRGAGDVAAANTEVANLETAAVAYMINSTLSPNATPPGSASVLYPQFISTQPKYYNYGFDTDGKVNLSQGQASLVGGLTWNLTGHKWIKS